MLTLTQVYIKRAMQFLICPVSYGLNRYYDQRLFSVFLWAWMSQREGCLCYKQSKEELLKCKAGNKG